MSNDNLPAVGDRIIVNDPELPTRFMGMEARVVSVDNSDLPLYVDFEIADAHSYWIHRGTWTVPKTLADVLSGTEQPMSNENQPLQPGDRIVIVMREDEWQGREGEYVGPVGGERRHDVLINGDHAYFFTHQIQRVMSDALGGATIPANASDGELRAIIERVGNDLTEEKSRSESREARRAEAQTRLVEYQHRYSHDLSWIDEYFRETLKPEQDWCDYGYNEVVRKVNSNMEGGFQFEEIEELEEVEVEIEGTVTATVSVWVTKGDDANDTDNWKDSDGDEIGDPDALIRDACDDERSRHGWDTLEVQ